MTVQQANDNIGKQFRLSQFNSGIFGQFDIIRRVKLDGTICGDFLEAHAELCQLKLPQPEQLKGARKRKKEQSQVVEQPAQAIAQEVINQANQDEYENFNGNKMI